MKIKHNPAALYYLIQDDNSKNLLMKICKELHQGQINLDNTSDPTLMNLDSLFEGIKIFAADNENLMLELKYIQNLMNNDDLKSELEQRKREIIKFSQEIESLNVEISFLNEIIDFGIGLDKLRNYLNEKDFYQSAKQHIELTEKSATEGQLSEVKIVEAFVKDSVILREKLVTDIEKLWNLYVEISDKENDKICLKVNSPSFNECENILKAVSLLGDEFLRRGCFEPLKNRFIMPLIKNEAKLFVIDHHQLVLKVNARVTPNYKEVYDRIYQILNFLFEHFGSQLMQRLGTAFADDLTRELIDNCLSEVKSSELREVAENTEKFENALNSMGFLPKGNTTLLDYAKNLNVLLNNKLSQGYLSEARQLMKKDLHVTVDVELVDDIVELLSVFPKRQVQILGSLMKIEKSFTLSVSQISKSVAEMLELINLKIVSTLSSVSDEICALRLFHTIRNIFELYAAIVPLHHKKMLKTIPQQVAVFHNNCLHLAYRLLQLAVECYTKWDPCIKEHYVLFLEESIEVRRVGVHTLEQFVSNQRSQLVYILRDSPLAVLSENPKLPPSTDTTDKCLRQCVRSLQLLQSAWLPVLPYHVYCNAMGFLADAFTEEVIHLILQAEDISSETASELVTMFSSIISERVPNLFHDSNEVFRICRRWSRFQEFVRVLNGSLVVIGERWSDGMGPLAVEFTADQVKRLVRALFQNTDRRATLLARIK